MSRKKYGEPLSYFTMKFTDKQYATVCSLAATLGISVGELIRRYVNALPQASDDEVERWKLYRKQSGHDKVAVPLEVMDQKAAAAAQVQAQIAAGNTDMARTLETLKGYYKEFEQAELQAQVKEEAAATNMDELQRKWEEEQAAKKKEIKEI